MPYDVVYPDNRGVGLPEQLGTKEKFWVKIDSQDWLLKFGRPGTGEDWAEKAACELARSCPGAWCKSVALYAAPGG